MKKKMVISVVWLFLAAVLVCMPVHASEKDAAGILEQIKQQLSEAFDSMDEDTAVEVFAFLKSQVSEGNLASDEGVEKAITEGEKKFGVELDEADARALVDTMEKLEDMGFSAEDVVEKAESLYGEYGAEFVDHADELVKGAVANAAQNALNSFWDNIKSSVKGFFDGLFS